MAVFFHFNNVTASLKNRRRLKGFIPTIFDREGLELRQLDYVFCTDDYLLNINREFLHHDTLTDIVTFDLSEPEKAVSAEIYISVERVRENAAKFGVSFEQELHRVMFHGVLHLCGYHDKTPEEKSRMRQKEEENLKFFFHE